MPRLERTIEKRGDLLLYEAGFLTVKMGSQGWPDRLVLFGQGGHCWIEWKAPGGKLTAAQERRIPKMRAAGDTVFICDDPYAARDVVAVLASFRRWKQGRG